jgi:transcriptional regulator
MQSSLQLKVNREESTTTVFFNYTLSSLRNNTDGAFSIAPSGDQALEWGPANGDVRHRLNTSINNQIVKNLLIVININGASAAPYTIRTGLDDNGDLVFNDRPAGVGRNSARGAWPLDGIDIGNVFTYKETMLEAELRKGSAELLVLGVLQQGARHGYDIARVIEERSGGAITFHSATLYPTLYRLERKKLIVGRWVEKAGQRRRRFYRITPAGRAALGEQRSAWARFFDTLQRVVPVR